jgi:hypothetical protein
MAQQSEFIESINIDLLKIIKLHALYTALGATINSNIIYFVKLRLSNADAIAEKRAISSFRLGVDCHSPLSKEARISSSSKLSF